MVNKRLSKVIPAIDKNRKNKRISVNKVGLLRKIILAVLKGYQMTHVMRQPSCRFYPSCSKYSSIAIERHGLLRGLILTVVRIMRCHPFHSGGVDEVPETFFTGLDLDQGKSSILQLWNRRMAGASMPNIKALPQDLAQPWLRIMRSHLHSLRQVKKGAIL